MDAPNGTIVTFTYDGEGHRTQKTLNGTTTLTDVYTAGRLAKELNGTTLLATFIYDSRGVPTSVVVGDPSQGGTTRYYYVYNAHGDVVALVDTNGTVQASYSYDAFGNLTSSSENLSGWSNPYRFDGAELVRYDPETGLYWMRVRAYDPTLGRFISHDPLGRLAVQGLDMQPYVYAANNPVNYTDPTGLYISGGPGNTYYSPDWPQNPGAPMINCEQGHNDIIYPACAAFNQWEDRAKDARDNQLNPQQTALGITGFGLTLADMAVQLVILDTTNDAKSTILSIIDIASDIITAGSFLCYIPDFPCSMYFGFSQVAHAIIALARGALGILNSWGWLLGDAADVATNAVKIGANGLFGPVLRFAATLLGQAVFNGISMFLNDSLSAVYNGLRVINDQRREPIWKWCATHDCSDAGPMPAYIVPQW